MGLRRRFREAFGPQPQLSDAERAAVLADGGDLAGQVGLGPEITRPAAPGENDGPQQAPAPGTEAQYTTTQLGQIHPADLAIGALRIMRL